MRRACDETGIAGTASVNGVLARRGPAETERWRMPSPYKMRAKSPILGLPAMATGWPNAHFGPCPNRQY